MVRYLSALVALFALLSFGQSGIGASLIGTDSLKRDGDTTRREKIILAQGNAQVTIRSVDISHFPIISVIFTAMNDRNEFIRTLRKDELTLLEDNLLRPVLSLDLITARDRVPIDFIFVVDVTSSMQDKMDSVRNNLSAFGNNLRSHGIDFELGMVTFRDTVDFRSPHMTSDVGEFNAWVSSLVASGGGDQNENALEGIRAATQLPSRNYAQKVLIIVTDALYHQAGDHGDGTTEFTSPGMARYLRDRQISLYALVPPGLLPFDTLAIPTGGMVFDIHDSYEKILGRFLENVSDLYSLKYLSQSTLLPDSVRVDILRADDRALLDSKKMAVLEKDRRLVFEELNFAPNSSELRGAIIPELERVVQLMRAHPLLRIKIEGHADSSGTPEINYNLSTERALSVKRYLTMSGIRNDRIETVGFGATRPIASNATEEGRKLNRRIEFVVLEK